MSEIPPQGVPDATVSHANNFNFIRLVLALCVLVSHAQIFIGHDLKADLFMRLSHNRFTLGSLAVSGFFAVSGFLILQSWLRSKSLLSFLGKRALRIYPAYIVTACLTTLVLAPLVMGPEQFASKFSVIRFLAEIPLLLYGSFPAFAPAKLAVINGSMWTIPIEAACYLFLGVAGLLGLWRRPLLVVCLWMGLFAYYVQDLGVLTVPIFNQAETRPYIFFITGTLLYLLRDHIKYTRSNALVALLFLAVSVNSSALHATGLLVFGTYLLFYFAQLDIPALRRFRTGPDLSYGTYLIAYPVQITLVRSYPQMPVWLHIAIAATISLIYAYLSWTLVEKPCLRFKGRFGKPKAALNPK